MNKTGIRQFRDIGIWLLSLKLKYNDGLKQCQKLKEFDNVWESLLNGKKGSKTAKNVHPF